MGPKIVILQPRKLDKEFAQPFTLEVNINDIIEFSANGADFTVTIPNKDNFLLNEDGTDADDNLEDTITDGNSKKWKVNSQIDAFQHKYYNVCWNAKDIYADRPGNSPPRIIIAP
jgi:hypothetical protein